MKPYLFISYTVAVVDGKTLGTFFMSLGFFFACFLHQPHEACPECGLVVKFLLKIQLVFSSFLCM